MSIPYWRNLRILIRLHEAHAAWAPLHGCAASGIRAMVFQFPPQTMLPGAGDYVSGLIKRRRQPVPEDLLYPGWRGDLDLQDRKKVGDFYQL